ncbi:MAG: hypothetical protein HY875_13820 [Chloroflexi bacterium]|nr:hypothetical protein [Chloroflexota bacterium]
MAALSMQQTLIGDLREVRFSFDLDGEIVPGLMYLPAEPEGLLPFVLIQHPATSSKDDYFVEEPARAWAQRGWACAGIDAPLHGDRREYDPMRLFKDRSLYPAITAQFAREVTAAIDTIAAEFPIDLSRLAYVGYSMGAMLGVPAIASDGRFKAAALCLVGEGGFVGPAAGEGSVIPRLSGVAIRIVAKSNDELVSRAATEALYAALPGPKDIAWFPGGHFEIGPEVIRAAGDWLKARL